MGDQGDIAKEEVAENPGNGENHCDGVQLDALGSLDLAKSNAFAYGGAHRCALGEVLKNQVLIMMSEKSRKLQSNGILSLQKVLNPKQAECPLVYLGDAIHKNSIEIFVQLKGFT